jgi:hypothetical protein
MLAYFHRYFQRGPRFLSLKLKPSVHCKQRTATVHDRDRFAV